MSFVFNGGILNKAQMAVDEYQNASQKEQDLLDKIDKYMSEEIGDITGGDEIEEIIEDGSLEHPYKIEYIEDLVELSLAVWNSETEKYENKYFLLTKDLDFQDRGCYRNPDNTSYGDVNANGKEQTIIEELTNVGNGMGNASCMIGNEYKPFTGIFLGNKKEIKNFYLKGSKANSKANTCIGLFGQNNGTIKDLSISGIIERSTSMGEGAAGGIAGINNGEISNCMNKISINNSNMDTADGAILKSTSGGIAGINNGKISNCYNVGKIKGYVDYDYPTIGGIVGQLNGEIINCYNDGEIDGISPIKSLADDEEMIQGMQELIFPWMEIDTIKKFFVNGIKGLSDSEKYDMYEYIMNKLEGKNEKIINEYIYGTNSENESIEELKNLVYIITDIYEDSNTKVLAQFLYFYIEAEARGYILATAGGIVGKGEGTIQNSYNAVKANGGIIAVVTGNIIINNCGYLLGTAEKGILSVVSGTIIGEARPITVMPNPIEILNEGQDGVWVLDENRQPALKD